MNEIILKHWWLLALRGAIAVLFGLLAIAWPAITLLTLALFFAAFALLAGAVWTFGAIASRTTDQRWWLMLLLGLVSLAAGVLAAIDPALTTLALVLVMGVNALVSGVIDIVVAVRLRRHMRGEWLLLLSGVVAVVFGIIVLMFPTGAGALALALLTACYALITGSLLLALAFQVRAWSRLQEGRSSPPAGAT